MNYEAPSESGLLAHARILISQPFLYQYAGSEVVTLELAESLASAGADVSIVSSGFSEPLAREVDALQSVRLFQMDSGEFSGYLDEQMPDLVWVHQGMVPEDILRRAGETRFVFAHLSPAHPSESPFVPDVEKTLADAVYYVSAYAKEVHAASGAIAARPGVGVYVLDNPAPAQFHQHPKNLSENSESSLSSLLVVSNHVPAELVDAIRQLRVLGVRVRVVGIPQEGIDSTPERVTPALIADYDAVVTIGKTVQYALVAGKPVYCYDHFGGPGWLQANNYEEAKHRHFSGRGGPSRSEKQIVEELTEGYVGAAAYAKERLEESQEEFGYSRIIHQVATLLEIPPAERTKLDEATLLGYLNAHATVRGYGDAYYQERTLTRQHIVNLEDIISSLESELRLLRQPKVTGCQRVVWALRNPIPAARALSRRLRISR